MIFQTIAVMVKNLLILDYGISTAFPIILVPALTGLGTGPNSNESMRITAAEASWLGKHKAHLNRYYTECFFFNLTKMNVLLAGSMLYIPFMFSSIFSGILIEPLGRRTSMILVNIPCFLGWISLYFSTSHTHVFIGMAMLGLASGLMESPVVIYVGEIW